MDGESETFVPVAFTNQAGDSAEVSSTIKAGCHGALPMVTHALRADGFDASEGGTGRGTPLVPTSSHTYQGDRFIGDDESWPCLPAQGCNNGGGSGAILESGVRRLTPRECERLQGFPDNYTLITHRGKPAADGPRYKALGNSWAVPCVRWIFERMDYVDSLLSPPR